MKTKTRLRKLPRTKKTFQFYSSVELKELTALKAKSVKELLMLVRRVPGNVIYHHTHQFLQQHQYLTPEPSNDFAYWVTDILGLDLLGEKLAAVNISEFKTIREIRRAIIKILQEYLKTKTRLREASPGEEFYFVKSVSFHFATPYSAADLREFVQGLRKISIESLYYHMFEAKLRLKRGGNDFSYWFETSLWEGPLAEKIEALDPYTHTLESLRTKIVDLVEKRIKEITRKR